MMLPFRLKKILRSRVMASLSLIVMVQIVCICTVCVSLAAKGDCDRLISGQSFKDFDSKMIEKIQKRLKHKGHDPVKIDGKVGQLTIDALKAFCADIKINSTEDLAGDVIAALLGPAVHSQTGQVIVSYKLTEDDLKQLETAAENIGKLKELQNVIYDNEHSFMAAVESKIPALTQENKTQIKEYAAKPTVYKLSQRSFDKLKDKNIPDTILDQLQGLKGKYYASISRLEREVKATIRDSADQYPLPTVKETGKSFDPNLGGRPFEDLKKDKVPDDILKQIQALIDKNDYPSKNEFEAAVDEKVNPVALSYNRYPSMIGIEAEEHDTYQLDDQSFRELQGQGIPDDILNDLQKYQNVPYANRAKVQAAVGPDIKAKTSKYVPLILKHSKFIIITNRLSGTSFKELKIEGVPDDILEELQILKSSWYLNNWYFSKKNFETTVKKIVKKKTDHYLKLVSISARETRAYRLSENALEELKKKKDSDHIPDHILDKVQELQDKDYASRDALKADVKVKIRELVDQYKSLIMAYIEEVYKSSDQSFENLIVKEAEEIKAYELTEESIDKLSNEIISDPATIEKLRQLQGIEYASKTQFVRALSVSTRKENIHISEKNLALIVDQAEQRHVYEDKYYKAIEWNSESCGCVLEDLSGVVYGFYPFWMAGEQQQLDFSVLSRIGYYALSFNDNGAITRPWHWNPQKAEFIKKAQKYRTAVDLVIYQNNWKKWSDLSAVKKSYIFDELKTNIVKFAHIKLQDTFSRIKPILSLGTSSTPTMSNGVTIYFDGYPRDNDFKYLFIKFIKDLRANLNALKTDYTLNIMLDMKAIGTGVYHSDSLKQIIPKIEKGAKGYEEQNIVDHFLVFIDQPTTETKKDLRNKIEDLFTGIERRTMLRKTIPIISPARLDKQQFEDDLIYFEDNFGGVGFWTLPISAGGGVDFLNCLMEILPGKNAQANKASTPMDDVNVNADLFKLYRKEGAQPISGYRKFVTLHRWGGRILFDVLLVLIVVYALLAKFFCRFRALFGQFFWWFMGIILLFIGVFFSLLYFDPAWRNLAQGNLILLLGIFVIALISIFKYIKRSRQGENP